MDVSSINSNAINLTSGGAVANAAPSGAVDQPPTHVSGHHGHHHRQDRSELMSAVQQALTDSGLAMPTRNGRAHENESGEHDGEDERSDRAVSRTVRHDLNRLMHDLFAAVRQSQDGSNSSSATGTSNANADSGASTDAAQSTGAAAGTSKSRYGDFTTALQGLIQQLSGGGASGSNDILSRLQSDFNKLVNDVRGLASARSESQPGQTTININITINNGISGASAGAEGTGNAAGSGAAASNTQNASGTAGVNESNGSGQNAIPVTLKNFLENLLKNLQGLSAAGHSPIGATINETV